MHRTEAATITLVITTRKVIIKNEEEEIGEKGDSQRQQQQQQRQQRQQRQQQRLKTMRTNVMFFKMKL